jgi:hypothetical protein
MRRKWSAAASFGLLAGVVSVVTFAVYFLYW